MAAATRNRAFTGLLQRTTLLAQGAGPLQPEIAAELREARGGGAPLTGDVGAEIGARFGVDFSAVRVHADARGDALSRSVNAEAFTTGTDIFFAAGRYAPATVTGRRLLAHELTHVLQHASGRTPAEARVSHPGDALETEARSVADSVATGPTGPAVRAGGVQPHASAGPVQRVVAIAGTDLHLHPASLWSAKEELVTFYLKDIVQNDAGDLLFTDAYRARLIRETVQDMNEASTRFPYDSVAALARDVRQRVLVSLYMRSSQSRHKGFAYPNSKSDRTLGVGPKVNDAATKLWSSAKWERGRHGPEYFFTLSGDGRRDPYKAVVELFHEQSDARKRTLFACDYLVSVLHYRAWAESIGPKRYNRGVRLGSIKEPVLRWDGFREPMSSEQKVPISEDQPIKDTPLRLVTVSDEKDLIIGDHVTFYNHPSYTPLTKAVYGVWNLENAIVVDRRGGENLYQGHGYVSPRIARKIVRGKHGLLWYYNWHVHAARRLTRKVDHAPNKTARTAALEDLKKRYPNVRKKKAPNPKQWEIFPGLYKRYYPNPRKLEREWEIFGEISCGHVWRDLKELKEEEVPGLTNPCDVAGTIKARRPVHTSAGAP